MWFARRGVSAYRRAYSSTGEVAPGSGDRLQVMFGAVTSDQAIRNHAASRSSLRRAGVGSGTSYPNPLRNRTRSVHPLPGLNFELV